MIEDDDDIEYDYESNCKKCGHSPMFYRPCSDMFCNEGYKDASDDDPINYYPGEAEYRCGECKGTGIIEWCPECANKV